MIEKGWWVQLDFLHLDVGYKNNYEVPPINILKFLFISFGKINGTLVAA
jgi:hypothetical protein